MNSFHILCLLKNRSFNQLPYMWLLNFLIILCVKVSFSWLEQDTLDNQLNKEKGLFWLMVSLVLVHGSLACSFGPLMWQYFMAGVCGRKTLFTSQWPWSQERDRKGLACQYPPQVCIPNDRTSSHFLKFTPPPNSATWGPRLRTHGPWGTFEF